ncbi:hypothetical protein Tco_1261130, partial [Tanacetum coccineum]
MIRSLTAEPQMDEMKLSFAYGVWYLIGAMKKHGRTGRGPIIARASSSLNMEKLDDATSVKPLKSNRPGSEKNGSKMAHHVKKLMDRKWISRLYNLQNNGSESTGHA